MRVHATVADKGDVVGLHESWRGRLWLLDSERWGWRFEKERLPSFCRVISEGKKGGEGKESTLFIWKIVKITFTYAETRVETGRNGCGAVNSQVSIQWGRDARAFSTIFLRICYIVQKELPASRLQYSSQYSNWQQDETLRFLRKAYVFSYAEPEYFAYAGWKREGGEQTIDIRCKHRGIVTGD